MNSQQYRAKLSALEQEMYEPQSSTLWKSVSSYKEYLIIVFTWFVLLVLFTPSFLYTPKKKHQPQSRLWTMIIILWILLSAASGAGYFYLVK